MHFKIHLLEGLVPLYLFQINIFNNPICKYCHVCFVLPFFVVIIFASNKNKGPNHPAHSSLRKESPAELMLLVFVLDKTGSGTGRSKKENRHSIPYDAHPCPRGSLVPYKNQEQISCAVHFLCCSSLSQRQSRSIQK